MFPQRVSSTSTGLLYLLFVLTNHAHCQSLYSPAQAACCALNLMDTSQQVAIETERVLTSGQYRAASLRVCDTGTVFMQIWTRVDNANYQLKWQTSFTPTTTQIYQNYATIAFDASNLPTITPNDRLGLYGVVSSTGSNKLDIPYDVDESVGSVHFTQNRYNNTTIFATGLLVSVEDFRWPRSFASYVRFCTRTDCSDVPSDSPAASTTSRPASLPSCGCPTSCSPDASLSDSIDTQARNIQVLQDQINRMSDLVDSLSSANVQTGFCPDNFVPGVYGVGSCYIVIRDYVQLGEAALHCSTDYGANLLDIESDVEERFIYSLVTNNGTSPTAAMETFWTSGMYSQGSQQWTWYSQDWTPKATIGSNSFNAWLNNNEPTPTTDIDTCLVLAVDGKTQSSYWLKNMCISLNYYICKVPKICY